MPPSQERPPDRLAEFAAATEDVRIRFGGLVDERSIDLVCDYFRQTLADCDDVADHLEHLRIVVRSLAVDHDPDRLRSLDDDKAASFIRKVIFCSTLVEVESDDPRELIAMEKGPTTAETKASLSAWQPRIAPAERHATARPRARATLVQRQRRSGERRAGRARTASTRSCARSGSSGDDPPAPEPEPAGPSALAGCLSSARRSDRHANPGSGHARGC